MSRFSLILVGLPGPETVTVLFKFTSGNMQTLFAVSENDFSFSRSATEKSTYLHQSINQRSMMEMMSRRSVGTKSWRSGLILYIVCKNNVNIAYLNSVEAIRSIVD